MIMKMHVKRRKERLWFFPNIMGIQFRAKTKSTNSFELYGNPFGPINRMSKNDKIIIETNSIINEKLHSHS